MKRAGSSAPGGERRARSKARLGERGSGKRGPGADAPPRASRGTHRCEREGRCAAAGLPVAGEAGWGGDEGGMWRARREGDDTDRHRDGAAAVTALRLASCSDRSRIRLRPPAGNPPSPEPRRAHVTATERPRGRGRRGPAGGARARARREGALGAGPLRQSLRRPAAPSLRDLEGERRRGEGPSRAWPTALVPGPPRNGLLRGGYCSRRLQRTPVDCVRAACSPAATGIRSGRGSVVRAGGDDPERWGGRAGRGGVVAEGGSRRLRLQPRSPRVGLP